MITKEQIDRKTRQLAAALQVGKDIKCCGRVLVKNTYYVNCITDSEEMKRLVKKRALGFAVELELKKLCELEALKIADEYALDILEMEQEK